METPDDDAEFQALEGEAYAYERGYEVGQVIHDHDSSEDSNPGEAYINNHIRLTVTRVFCVIDYHLTVPWSVCRLSITSSQKSQEPALWLSKLSHSVWNTNIKSMWARLLPVCAQACTCRWAGEETALSTCKPLTPVSHKMAPQKLKPADEDTEIVWTYDISWVESDTRWASRWDMYLLVTDDQVHWFSVFNSLVTVVFLSGNSHFAGQ